MLQVSPRLLQIVSSYVGDTSSMAVDCLILQLCVEGMEDQSLIALALLRQMQEALMKIAFPVAA